MIIMDEAKDSSEAIVVGYEARRPYFGKERGVVKALSVQAARNWVESKGWTAKAVFQLQPGENIASLPNEVMHLRNDYEYLREEVIRRRGRSEGESLAKRWLEERLRELDEQRAAGSEVVEVSTANGYTTALSPQQRKVIAKKARVDLDEWVPLTIVRMTGFSFVGVIIDVVANQAAGLHEPMLATVGLGVTTLVGSLVARANSKAAEPFRQKAIESFRALEGASLRAWLYARYGLSVRPDTLAGLANEVIAGKNGYGQIAFKDDRGESYKLMLQKEGWLAVPVEPTDDRLLRVPAALDRAQAALGRANAILKREEAPIQPLFAGEVALIYARIEEMLRLLSVQPLTSEEQHVVNRVKQDVETTASTLSSLAALGDRDSGQQRAADVLGQLVDELNELVAEKKAALLANLDVQRAYVKERRLAVGGSARLVLPKPAKELGIEKGEVAQ